jgi:3-isopropylmalate/(R)-2-methylmalate dehydratase small subunit
MEPFRRLEAIACALPLSGIDTDQLIPARFMSRSRSEGYGGFLLHDLRFDADGQARPDFPLNDPDRAGARILVARRNFGGGSSREAAAYALVDYGIRCVIAPSFGDIFHNNCFQNGLLPVRLPFEIIQRMAEAMEESPGNARVTVDLEKQVVVTPWGEAVPFAVDARKREALLSGLDEIAQTLQRAAEIAAWQARDRAARGWAWDSVGRA